MEVPWPPIYLVAEATTMSAPCSIGRTRPTPIGVVHDQRDAGVVGDLGEGFEIRHVELGVADGFGVDRARLRGDGLAERVEILGIHEAHGAAQFGQGVVEELVGAAIEIVGGDDFVAQPG